MRTRGILLVVLAIILMATVLPANARQDTRLTVDSIAAVRMAGFVYWENRPIWKFQIFSGPNTPSQVLVVPQGATVKYTLDGVGSDPGKPIRVSVDQGGGEQPAYSELSYCAERDDMIVCRTVYVGAVREDRPLFKLIIGIGSKVSHADTKGVWIFPINTIEFPVTSSEQAVQAMMLGRSAGTPIGIEMPGSAQTQPRVEDAAPPQVFADGPATDSNFEKQGEMNKTLLDRDERLADGLQANDQRDNEQDARLGRLEQAWQAQTRPAADAPPVVNQNGQLSYKEQLLAKWNGQDVWVFALSEQSPMGEARYTFWQQTTSGWAACQNQLVVRQGNDSFLPNSRLAGWSSFGLSGVSAGAPTMVFKPSPGVHVIILGGEGQ